MKKILSNGTVHNLPNDFIKSLDNNMAAITWEDITPLARNEWICWVESAKQISTRQRRLRIAIENLGKGKRRPCCWSGCIHRPDYKPVVYKPKKK